MSPSQSYDPPRGFNVQQRLMWLRDLAQRGDVAATTQAILQLSDLVQELYEWRDRIADRDAWDGSDW